MSGVISPPSNQQSGAGGPTGVAVGGLVITPKTVADYDNFQSLENSNYPLQEDYPELFAKMGAVEDRSGAADGTWVKNTVTPAALNITTVWTDGTDYIFGGSNGVIYHSTSPLGVLSVVHSGGLNADNRIEAIQKFKGKYYAVSRDNYGTAKMYEAVVASGPWTELVNGVSNYTDDLYVDANYLIATNNDLDGLKVATDNPTSGGGWVNIALAVRSIYSKGDGVYVATGRFGKIFTTTTPENVGSWVQNTAVPNSTDNLYKVIYHPTTDKFYALAPNAIWSASDPTGQWVRLPVGLAQGSAGIPYSVATTYDGFFVTMSISGYRGSQNTFFVDFDGNIEVFSLDTDANAIDPTKIYTVMAETENQFIMAGYQGVIYTHARKSYNSNIQFFIEKIAQENPKLKHQMRLK